jgi:hypothetical protein
MALPSGYTSGSSGNLRTQCHEARSAAAIRGPGPGGANAIEPRDGGSASYTLQYEGTDHSDAVALLASKRTRAARRASLTPDSISKALDKHFAWPRSPCARPGERSRPV